jgi:protein-disulfide isomerase
VNRRSIPALALTVTLTIAGTILYASPQTAQKPQKLKPGAAATPAPAPAVAIISVSGVNDIDSSKAYGSKNAPVVMEIFSDFQCPACKALFTGTNQKLMDEYVSTGKVYLVHRDFPLPMHAYSRVAASYARAAAHIGKGEAVEQALFQKQEVWEANGDVKGTVASVLSPADMKRVQALVDGKTLEPLVDKDKQIGTGVPVTQTPTTVFHAKGQTFPYAGSITYQVLKDFLDQLMAK